jgi:anti-sigma regulatory factor (Ser/Thr protein kinase)
VLGGVPTLSRRAVVIERIELRTLDDVRVAQPAFRSFAAQLGFDRQAQCKIAIAASEAGTNMVKYGGGGELSLRSIEVPRVGLRFEARDHGPGIPDLARMLEDHISQGIDVRLRERVDTSPGGLGVGLGAIRRMMDTFGWQNLDDGGLLWAEKYLI